MTVTFVPRFYQTEAVEAAIKCLEQEPDSHPILALPTGTGKSPIIGMLCERLLKKWPGLRILVATHVKELIEQDSKALKMVWPSAPYGIYSAGLAKKQSAMPITICSVQSAVKNLDAFGVQHILIVDECHLISPESETNYQNLIDHLKKKNPKLRIVGLSATPYRMKSGMLTDGPIFNKIAYDITGREAFVRLIEMGFLCPLFAKPTKFRYDVSKVRTVAGDFNQLDLEKEINTDDKTERALQEALQIGEDRNHWILFCAGIKHIESVCSMLESWGETVVYVHSKMGKTARDAAIAKFKSGEVRMIVSDNILRTGFDAPFVDHIVLLCPTKSAVRHVQSLGRGTRVFFGDGSTHIRGNMLYDQWGNCLDTVEGRLASIKMSEKQNCRVSDFAGNIERLGPINDPVIPNPKKKGKGEVPVKICPVCDNYNHAAARFCDYCDHEFPFDRTKKLEKTATAAIVVARNEPVTQWFKVDRVEYEMRNVPFRPPTMHVHYFSGMQRFKEVICIEHQGPALTRAKKWWKSRLPNYDPPPSTYEGMSAVNLLRVPTHVFIHLNSPKYPSVLTASFDGTTPLYTPSGSSIFKEEMA